MAKKIIVKLPPIFYFDHKDRDLPSGKIIKQTQTYVMVELTPDELDEIRSDADYYWEMRDEMTDLRSITSSAGATLRAIAKATN